VATIWEELKRRNVVRATLAYVVVGWLLAQVAEFATSTFGAPAWALKIFVVFLVLGLPLVVILAWAYEMTPHGLRKTDEAEIAQSAKNATGPRRNIVFAGLLVAALMVAAWIQFYDFDVSHEAVSSSQQVASRADNLSFPYHFDIALPNGAPLALIGAAALGNGRQAFAISPDGRKIVYVADKGGSYQLYLRELDGHDALALPDTENAYDPFFSPNGVWVGFFMGNQLRKIRIGSGNSVLVAEATNSGGAAWLESDEIIMSTGEGDALQRVSAQGGTVETLSDGGSFPRALSGRSDIVLIAMSKKSIVAFNTETRESKVLPVAGAEARYANGFLFYLDGSSLYAARFDPNTLTLGSTPIPILTGVRSEVYGVGQWSISDNGILLFAPGTSAGSNPMYWANAATSEALDLPMRERGSFEVSPDGRQFVVIEESAGAADIWLYDFEKYQPRKLTVEGHFSGPLFWMPDGKSIVYHKYEGEQRIPYRQYLDIGGSGEPLLPPGFANNRADSITHDGKYVGASGFTDDAIKVIDLVNETTITFPTVGEVNWGTAVSPDGRYVVYTSAESGVYQIYLQPIPPTGTRYQVSRVGGAEEPRWSRDGKTVYYRSGNRIMAVSIATEPELTIGEPDSFFRGEFENVGGRSYDVHPDGQRVLVIRADNAMASIRVVTNWFGEVERVIRENEAASP
jgi:Tol biopolymer transport system component